MAQVAVDTKRKHDRPMPVGSGPVKKRKASKVPKTASKLFDKWQAIRKDMVRTCVVARSGQYKHCVTVPMNASATPGLTHRQAPFKLPGDLLEGTIIQWCELNRSSR